MNNKNTPNTVDKEEQQESEQITGDVFNSFNQDPTLTEILPQTKAPKLTTKHLQRQISRGKWCTWSPAQRYGP